MGLKLKKEQFDELLIELISQQTDMKWLIICDQMHTTIRQPHLGQIILDDEIILIYSIHI